MLICEYRKECVDMKKMSCLILLMVLFGCMTNESDKCLKDYESGYLIDDRDNITVMYDYDGIFDEYTPGSLIEYNMIYKEETLEDKDFTLKNYTIEEINKKNEEYRQMIMKDILFIFDDDYQEVKNEAIDERDIRIILKNDDNQINIYQDGYVKVITEEKTLQYISSDKKFNDNIDKFYDTIAQMNSYWEDVRKDIVTE